MGQQHGMPLHGMAAIRAHVNTHGYLLQRALSAALQVGGPEMAAEASGSGGGSGSSASGGSGSGSTVWMAAAGAVGAAAAVVAWWQWETVSGAVAALWFGEPGARDRRHADLVFEATRDNCALLADRLGVLEARARDAGVVGSADAAPAPPSAAGAAALTGSRANGYYYFTSDGKPLRTKWDSFDTDAALAAVDAPASAATPPRAAAAPPAAPPAAAATAPGAGRAAAQPKPASVDAISLRALREGAGGLERAVEVVMADLDEVSGTGLTEAQRATRKQLADSCHRLLARVDVLLAATTAPPA